MVWCFSSIFRILWVYAPVILIFSFEVLRFPPSLLVFWLFQTVRVTWLIKIQVKIIIFRFCIFIFSAHFVSDIGFEWRPRTPFIINFFSGPSVCMKSILHLDKFSRCYFYFFLFHSIFLVFAPNFTFLFTQEEKVFDWNFCPTLKVFLMIDACAHKEQAN